MSSYTLKRGDKVALVCTGTACLSKTDPLNCQTYLLQHGLQAVFDQDAYLTLPPKRRAEILLQHLQDDSVQAIWSIRGGEGTADILPYLHGQIKQLKKRPKKQLIGFSDFTPLLVYFSQQLGWPVMHGMSLRQAPRGWVDKQTIDLTFNRMMGAKNNLTLKGLIPFNAPAKSHRIVTAPVVGGNLSLLQISLQDCWQIDVRHKILLLEEVAEKPYRVARMLNYLQRIGFFNGAKAVILAGFDFPSLSRDRAIGMKRAMDETFYRFAKTLSCPVLFTDLVGHGQTNYPIPFEVEAKLALDAHSATLSFTQ